jgi:hypothetical protein
MQLPEEELLINPEQIILNKKNLKVIKNKKNEYSILYNIKNSNIYLQKIINFNLIQLICEINKEIFDEYKVEIINENEARIYILMKHYFKEVGLPLRYSYLNIKLIKTDNAVEYQFTTIYNEMPNNVKIPENASLLPMNNMEVICIILDNHNIKLRHNIYYSEHFIIPDFLEKFSLTLFSKMFIRTKQFIENIK